MAEAVDREPVLALYHFEGCPYCAKVRRAAARLGVPLELRDVTREPAHRAELVAVRGRPTVPVLRITSSLGDVRWHAESESIIRWLHERAGLPRTTGSILAERLFAALPWLLFGGSLLTGGPLREGLLLSGLAVLLARIAGPGPRG